jgi:hypothetical protein
MTYCNIFEAHHNNAKTGADFAFPGSILFLYPGLGDFPKYVFSIMGFFLVSFVYIKKK